MSKIKSLLCFNLRTLLVLVTVISVGLGMAIKKSRDRRQAVETIRSLGGSVIYLHEKQSTEPTSPRWLRQMFGDELFFQVDSVGLLGPKFNDNNVAVIKHLPEVRWLSSYYSKVTDQGMRHFRGLRNLEELYLTGLEITDDGLENLEGLRGLKRLQIHWCSLEITSEGKDRLVRALPQFTATSNHPVRSGTFFLGDTFDESSLPIGK